MIPVTIKPEEEYEDTEEYEDDCEDACQRYNKTYADTENDDIEFAMGVAAGWVKYNDDSVLIYTTQGDERVRPWHADLEGISYPKSSFPEWLIPPIDWGCRCYLEEDSGGIVVNSENSINAFGMIDNRLQSRIFRLHRTIKLRLRLPLYHVSVSVDGRQNFLWL